MSGYKVELNWDMVDEIVQQQLIDTWQSFKNDLGKCRHIFVWDNQEADDAEIQRHIDALEVVMRWYCTPEQLKEMGIDGK